MEEMKTWQKGFSKDVLLSVKEFFDRSYNDYSLSPFTEMNNPTIASALHKGTLQQIVYNDSIYGYLNTNISGVTNKIKMCKDVVLAEKQKGDRVIKQFTYDPDNYDPVVNVLNSYKEPCWLFIWEEDRHMRQIATYAGFDRIGIKISSTAELTGVYFRDAVGLMPGTRQFPLIPRPEKCSVHQLDVPEFNVSGIRYKLESLGSELTYTNHYSNYNNKKSWSALSLRGYTPDPHFITKPSEMNKKWQEEHSHWPAFEIQNTWLLDYFPQIIKILDIIPGKKHRVRFMKLKPQGSLGRHTDIVDVDSGVGPGKLMRLHIPIQTNTLVEFSSWTWEGNQRTVCMGLGELWYLDTRKPHAVENNGNEERIHLVIDVVANKELIDLIIPY